MHVSEITTTEYNSPLIYLCFNTSKKKKFGMKADDVIFFVFNGYLLAYYNSIII